MKTNQKPNRAPCMALFALPLAALCCVLSCLNPVAVDKDEPVEYTADGRPLVNVSLKTTRGGGGGCPLFNSRIGPGRDRLLRGGLC